MVHLHKIAIEEIMVKRPITLAVNEPFSRVEMLFRTHGIRHLPIVDEEHRLVGIISQRDLYRVTSPRRTLEGTAIYERSDLDQFILSHVMTKDVFTLGIGDTLGHVIDVMVKKKFGCIPIVNQERKLLGIVTQIDVLRTIEKYFI